MSTHVAPELLEEAKRLREALREIEQATEGIPEQNCMIANRIARLTLGDARAAAAEGFFARGDDGQYRTDPAPGCPHGSPAGSARDCACNEPDVPCNHQWVPAQFCIKCGLQGFPEPAPTLERHWQDDADHDPGRAQTAYQAEQTRVAEGTVGGIKTLNPWAQGEVGRVVAERAALRVAMGETPQEQWQEMAARVARAEDRTMSAEAERDALRAEVERLERARLRSGDWLTLDKLDAEVAAAKDAQIEALLENVDLRAEVSRSHAAILALTGEVERLRVLVDGSVGWRCAQEQRIRAEKAEAALRTLLDKMERIEASEAYRSVWIVAQIHSGPYHGENWAVERNAARAALRDTAPSEDRHWQNDADPNPGREQTAYQAEVEREKP